MEHVPVTGQLDRQINRRAALQARSVAQRPLAAFIVVLVDVLKLRTEDSRMKIVEAAVEPEAVHVASIRTVIAQLAGLGVNLRVVGDERAAVAEGSQVFLNNEADGGRIAQFSDLEAGA